MVKKYACLMIFILIILCGFMNTTYASDISAETFLRGAEFMDALPEYQDFLDSIDEVVLSTNEMIDSYNTSVDAQEKQIPYIDADDVDFSRMFKRYVPSDAQLSEALSQNLTKPPEDWRYIWILPVTVSDFTVQFVYQYNHGIDDGHLRTDLEGNPGLSEESLAQIAAKEGHFCIASAYSSSTDDFEQHILTVIPTSAQTALSEAEMYYIDVSLTKSRAAWFFTDNGNFIIPTNTQTSAQTAVLSSSTPVWTQEEFAEYYQSIYTTQTALTDEMSGDEPYYGAGSIEISSDTSDTGYGNPILISVISASVITLIAGLFLRFRKRPV